MLLMFLNRKETKFPVLKNGPRFYKYDNEGLKQN